MLADDDQLFPVAAMFSSSSSDYFRFDPDSVAVGRYHTNNNVTSFPFGEFLDVNYTTVTSALTAGSDGATLRAAAAFLDNDCAKFRFVVNTVIIGALCVFGFAGNTLSMVILQRDRHNRVAVFLLQSLAAADNSVLIMSLLILSVLYGLLPETGSCGIETVKRATPYMIKYVNPVGYVAQSCAIWITVLLAVNRYVAVCRPYDAPRWLTLRRTRIQVLVVVLVSVVLNIPRIFQFDIDPYPAPGNDTINVSRPLYHYSELGLNVYFETIYLNAFYTSVVLVLPLLLVVGLNVGLVRRLQASKRRMQHNSLLFSGSSENSITAVMVAIVLELVLCHTPDRILQIVRYINSPKGATKDCPNAFFYAVNVTNLLIIISSSTNFIIYFVFRRRFRRAVAKRLACCGGDRNGLRRSSSLLSTDRDQLPTSRLSNGSLGTVGGHHVNGARGGNNANHRLIRISSEPVGVVQRTFSDSSGPLAAVKAHLLNHNRSTSMIL